MKLIKRFYFPEGHYVEPHKLKKDAFGRYYYQDLKCFYYFYPYDIEKHPEFFDDESKEIEKRLLNIIKNHKDTKSYWDDDGEWWQLSTQTFEDIILFIKELLENDKNNF